jgi:hypothetical protein
MLNSNDIKKISKIENVENAEIYTSASADYIQNSGSKKYKITLQSIAEGQNIQLDYLAGNQPQGTNEIVISQDYLEALKFNSAEDAIGKTIWICATNNITGMQKKYALKISGVLNKSLIQNTMGVISSELNDEIYSYNTEGLGDDVKNKGVAILAKIKGEKTVVDAYGANQVYDAILADQNFSSYHDKVRSLLSVKFLSGEVIGSPHIRPLAVCGQWR